MAREPLPLDLARQVTPRALTTYAAALGWQHVERANGTMAIYHRPGSPAHQVLIPVDEGLTDYGEMVAEATRKLAEFETRPARELLEHLLLPPADVLRFREVSPDAETGNLPFEHAVRLLNGTRRLLLSAAHSVLVPRPYHPRLSRAEAEEFVHRCRLSQTGRGSFVFNVACPLNLTATLPGMELPPFTRQVTELLMQSLEKLAWAADAPRAEELLDTGRNPGLSANLCESLLLLRPRGDRANLTVGVTWSRALLPQTGGPGQQVQLRQEVFEMAEILAPRLREVPAPRPSRFYGFVDVLRGQPTSSDQRPSGEVDFTLFDEQEGEIHARGILTADQYAIAGAAHLASDPVSFKGILRRLPRISRVDDVREFVPIHLDADEASETGNPSVAPSGNGG
jgi:hypothetical protein